MREPSRQTAAAAVERSRLSFLHTVWAIAIAAVVLLFLVATVQIDFVIFAGVLLGIFLNRVASLIGRHARLGYGWSLCATVLLIVVLAAGFGWLFAESVMSQADQLANQLPAALHRANDQLRATPWGKYVISSTASSGPSLSGIFGVASNAVTLIGGLVVVGFSGLYLAAEPGVYRRGIMHLLPPRMRERGAEVLARMGDMLWFWMLGRLLSMTVVGLLTVAGLWALGIPLPVALGGLAGLLTFIPYLGTVLSAIPALVIALSVDPRMVIYVALLYLGVHLIEGYILVPLVQRRAAHIPPVLILSAQLVLGLLVGLIGVAFATPVLAALIPLVEMLYVEDVVEENEAGDGPRLTGRA